MMILMLVFGIEIIVDKNEMLIVIMIIIIVEMLIKIIIIISENL